MVAIVNGEFTIKRLRLVNGAYELHPENPDFRPIRFGDGEVLEVFGVVVGVARKML
nr:S24 family peptidase [Herbaspirillum rubrisubalbicans]